MLACRVSVDVYVALLTYVIVIMRYDNRFIINIYSPFRLLAFVGKRLTPPQSKYPRYTPSVNLEQSIWRVAMTNSPYDLLLTMAQAYTQVDMQFHYR